jgi:hypothetical protein
MNYDVVIIGASLGGVAAALAAGRAGASVCLLEASAWTGGQFTVQGVCRPDENRFIDTVGSTASYREFRHRCRLHYRNNYRLSAAGASQPVLDPGGRYNAHQPQFAVEPKVGDAILKQMLSELPTVHLRLNATVSGAEVANDVIVSVTATDPGGSTRYLSPFFLDATDLGELLPRVLNVDEYVVGAEAADNTGEPGAPGVARANWIQPITFCIALEHRPAGDYTIPKPPDYEAHKSEQNYRLRDGDAITTMFAGDGSRTTMWNYRRYIYAGNFADPAFPYDLSMINTGSNDYTQASIPTGSADQDKQIIQRARDAALGYLYWLQTECPRDEGGTGYPELRPNPDAFGTSDGVAPLPYIRESRRILALKRIAAQEIQQAGNAPPRAQLFKDSCGVGTYAMMDGHELPGAQPSMGGFWIPTYPLQIPASALVPRRVKNLLAACKNIGTTHFTTVIYRLHPLEWNVGEAAGALAAQCLRAKHTPAEVVSDQHELRSYQRGLLAAGVSLFWWTDIQFGDALFEAVQMAGATQVMTGDGNAEMRFNADQEVSDETRHAIEQKVGQPLPEGDLSRGQVALWLLNQGLT